MDSDLRLMVFIVGMILITIVLAVLYAIFIEPGVDYDRRLSNCKEFYPEKPLKQCIFEQKQIEERNSSIVVPMYFPLYVR